MLSEQEKRELLEDALSKERQRWFETADRKAEQFVQKQISNVTVDRVIAFLMDVQKVRGPFPVSKSVSTCRRNFKL